MTRLFNPSDILLETVNPGLQKKWVNELVASPQPGREDFPRHAEAARKLVEFITSLTDNINPGRHTAYAYWVYKNYVDNNIQIRLSLPSPDEDTIREKLVLFNTFCDNETPIPIKNWANEHDQWEIKYYTKEELFNFVHQVAQGQLATTSIEEKEAKEEAVYSTDKEALATYRAAKQKERDLKHAVNDFSKHLYNEGGEEIILILGGPSLGAAGLNSLRMGAFAWWAYAQGTRWCVGFGEYFSNPHGIGSYLPKSDVLIYRKDGKSMFSLQYEGYLRMRDPIDTDIFKVGYSSNNLEEIPCGEFTLISVNLEKVNSAVAPETIPHIKRFIELYPKCDVSESVTFNQKQLLVADTNEDRSQYLPKLIAEKVLSMGYPSLKAYILDVYPAVFRTQAARFVNGTDIDKTVAMPGVDEYVSATANKVLGGAGKDANYEYLLQLIFRFKLVIEKDILEKKSGNLAMLYLYLLSGLVSKYSGLTNTDELKDFTFKNTD